MPPETKVAICMDMSDGCVRVCADGIRFQHPDITEQELIAELRKRIAWSKRHRKAVWLKLSEEKPK